MESYTVFVNPDVKVEVEADGYNIQDGRLVLTQKSEGESFGHTVGMFEYWCGHVKTDKLINNNQKGRV